MIEKVVREQALPFRVTMKVPNAETIAAFKAVDEMKKNPSAYQPYSSFSELLDEVGKDV